MDHKLVVVILPMDSGDPISTSAAMLSAFQVRPPSGSEVAFQQKFRYKQVGGWFDGLVTGQVGEQRWSGVLDS